MEIRTNLNLGLLNKYNPVSIQQELEWAAGVSSLLKDGLIALGDKYVDPYLRNQAQTGSLEAIQARRQQVQQYFAAVFSADWVVLTLGLTETWFDRTTRQALTEIPSPRLLQQYRDRFNFKQLSYPECAAVLKSICTLLKRYSKPELKILVTVSPVALERTFSGQDILAANDVEIVSVRCRWLSGCQCQRGRLFPLLRSSDALDSRISLATGSTQCH